MTKAQLQQKYKDEYFKLATCTKPANKKEAEKAIAEYYKVQLKIAPPKHIIWTESPMEAVRLAAKALKYTKGKTDFVEEELRAIPITTQEVRDQAYKASYGSFEAYYISYFDYKRTEEDKVNDPLVPIVKALCTHSGPYWAFDGLAIMSDKPCEIHISGDKIHRTDGPAILYRNGEGIYVVNNEVQSTLAETMLAQINGEK